MNELKSTPAHETHYVTINGIRYEIEGDFRFAPRLASGFIRTEFLEAVVHNDASDDGIMSADAREYLEKWEAEEVTTRDFVVAKVTV